MGMPRTGAWEECMAISTIGGVELTADTTWTDRFGQWSPFEMVHDTDIHGLPVIQISAPKQGGEPVALLVRNCTKPLLDTLRALAEASAGDEVVLVYDGGEFNVIFDFSEGHPVRGVPVKELPAYDVVGDDVPFWTVTVNCITV